jgi:hypothetical protein
LQSKTVAAWWLRVHVPVEVKAKNSRDEVSEGLLQLLGYMRQVLREQLDRCFTFGLLFCATDLSVWLSDRSGLLGTAKPINIHDVITPANSCVNLYAHISG